MLNKLKMCASDYLFIILLFFKTTGPGLCINSFQLKVPFEVDLQDPEVTLDCKYDMGSDELYSVKWYKDEEEFFRYIPRENGTRTFPATGVTVIGSGDTASECDSKHCPVTLTNMTRMTEGAYKCEVSTEAPKFALFFETANMSIVARPRGLVQIYTPKREYSDGEVIWLNCTSPPAFPPPNIRWYANSEQIGPENIISQSDSLPDDRGLVTRSLAVHLIASKDLFVQAYGALELQCQVHTPLRSPLFSSVILWLEGLQEQKFELLTESGAAQMPTIQSQILLLSISILYLLFNIMM